MNPNDLLKQASELIGERGADYGGIENNFQLIADIASLRLGRDIHPYEVAVIMVSVKNARNFANPSHMDSRLDAMNYEAFAALFAKDYEQQKSTANADIDYKRRKDFKAAVMSKPKTDLLTETVTTLRSVES